MCIPQVLAVPYTLRPLGQACVSLRFLQFLILLELTTMNSNTNGSNFVSVITIITMDLYCKEWKLINMIDWFFRERRFTFFYTDSCEDRSTQGCQYVRTIIVFSTNWYMYLLLWHPYLKTYVTPPSLCLITPQVKYVSLYKYRKKICTFVQTKDIPCFWPKILLEIVLRMR